MNKIQLRKIYYVILTIVFISFSKIIYSDNLHSKRGDAVQINISVPFSYIPVFSLGSIYIYGIDSELQFFSRVGVGVRYLEKAISEDGDPHPIDHTEKYGYLKYRVSNKENSLFFTGEYGQIAQRTSLCDNANVIVESYNVGIGYDIYFMNGLFFGFYGGQSVESNILEKPENCHSIPQPTRFLVQVGLSF